MTENDRDRLSREDHATLATIRRLQTWFLGGGFVVCVGLIWAGATGYEKMSRVAQDLAGLTARVTTIEGREGARDTATARLEEKLLAMTEALRRIEARLAEIGGGPR